MTDTPARLTCLECKRRKTKCDKQYPCSACDAAGLSCHPVQRARLPRGRTGRVKKQNVALEEKVARLESLLQRIEPPINEEITIVQSQSNARINGQAQPESQPCQSARKVEQFAARDFWVMLSNEVSGLRETLEASDEADIPDNEPSATTASAEDQFVSSNALVFQQVKKLNCDHDAPMLTVSTRQALLELYQHRVDVLLKVLHWPTFLSLVEGKHSTSTTAAKALENAVYFLALCSTTLQDCEDLRLGDRTQLLLQARHATENCLSATQLLVTNDVVLLQAFVIYLAALRCCENAAVTWTLIALAIRIAGTCGVGPENIQHMTPFEFEIRRRLWFSIGLLDSQAAFGRGSLPLISHKDLTPLPLVINDSEMSPEHVETISGSIFTEMTFPSLCHRFMVCQRKLCDPSISRWNDRVDVVVALEALVNQEYGLFEFSEHPFEKFTAYAAKDMAATMHLILRRPPYKPVGDPVPKDDSFDVLSMACRISESGLYKKADKRFAAYTWFTWPRWWALAVLLVELLNKKHSPTYDHAFAVAEKSFADYAQSASDVRSDLLWKPIVRLMQRLRHLRGTELSYMAYITQYVDPDASTLKQSIGTLDSPTPASADQTVSDDSESFKVPLTTCVASSHDEAEIQWLQWDQFLNDIGISPDTNLFVET